MLAKSSHEIRPVSVAIQLPKAGFGIDDCGTDSSQEHRASRQRLTRRARWCALPLKFSIGFVVADRRSRVAERPRPITVSVSSSPSRSDAATPGCFVSRLAARFSSSFLAF